MLRKLLFISLALLLVGSVFGFKKVNKLILAAQYHIDEAARQQILQATVRITLIAPLTDAWGNAEMVMVDGQLARQFVAGEGLGTLTQHGSEFVVVTHDHWTLLTPNLHKVQFHSAANELLLEMSGDAFQQLIRYQDGGTMVLTAPGELGVSGAVGQLGNRRTPVKNDVLLIAFRQPQSGEISVAAMQVTKLSSYEGQPVYRLTSLHGDSVVGGNSGGGVWVDGQLVGNMWTTTMEVGGTWLSGQAADSLAQTSQSLAAQLPETFLQ
jgi:hypothetical protein